MTLHGGGTTETRTATGMSADGGLTSPLSERMGPTGPRKRTAGKTATASTEMKMIGGVRKTPGMRETHGLRKSHDFRKNL
eukprot:4693725-Amphidinium_carterae.1